MSHEIKGSILDYFEAQVIKAPDQIAIQEGQLKITYGELNGEANRLARYIQCQYQQLYQSRLPKEARIVLLLRRGLKAVVTMLAILKAGGTYVPIDIRNPAKRIEIMLNDIIPMFIFKEDGLSLGKADAIPCIHYSYRCIDDNIFSAKNLDEKPKESDLSYIIYTSGSTGSPKGVMIEHRGIPYLVAHNNHFNIQAKHRIAHVGNLGFDVTVLEIYSALLNGARLVIAGNDILDFPDNLETFLFDNRIDMLFLTSALFEFYVTHNPSMFKGLRYLLVGGEVLKPEKAALLIHNLGGKPKHFINCYGPTECTVFTTFHRLDNFIDTSASISIGTCLTGTKAHVLDSELNPCSVGEQGELYLSGISLARGYLNKPKLTDKMFVFHPQTGERIYKTGDLVLQNENGTLRYFMRIDTQVKIRGNRIELGEIESIICSHPYVQLSTVIIHEVSDNKKILVAFCVLNCESGVDNRQVLLDLEQSVMDRLPDYMQPVHYIEIEKIPLTLNGKVDRLQLNELFVKNPLVTSLNKCIDSLQLRVLNIWEDVFNLKNINPNANFAEIGGDSITAVQLTHQLSQEFNLKLVPGWLVNHKTIIKQANALRRAMNAGHHYNPIITFNDKGDTLPLYMVHPAIIGAECYAELARQLGRQVNVFGIDSYNLYHNSVKSTVPSLADLYVDYILQHNQSSEIYLGGWSLGALIAIEICHRLEIHKIQVKKLFLIEPDPPHYARANLSNEYSAELEAMNAAPDYIISYLYRLPESLVEKTFKNAAHDLSISMSYESESMLQTNTLIFEATEWQHEKFLGKKISLQTWSRYFMNLKVIPLSGDHLSIMENDSLCHIAKILKSHLLCGDDYGKFKLQRSTELIVNKSSIAKL